MLESPIQIKDKGKQKQSTPLSLSPPKMLMDIENESSEDNLEKQQIKQATINSLRDKGFFFCFR